MKRRVIAVAMASGFPRHVEAIVFGRWAVHQRICLTDQEIPARERWGVTHLPTGGQAFAPSVCVTRRQAIACARALARRLPRLGGEFGVSPPVSDDWFLAGSTIAEVLGEGRAR